MSRGYTPRHAQTAGDWVSLYNLMMKLFGISRSSAILGSDSPQSNNRKDHSLWVTPFIPRERPNVKHAIAGYLRLPIKMGPSTAAIKVRLQRSTKTCACHPPLPWHDCTFVYCHVQIQLHSVWSLRLWWLGCQTAQHIHHSCNISSTSSSSSKSLPYVTFWLKWSFKWHCPVIQWKRCSQLMRWIMYRWEWGW